MIDHYLTRIVLHPTERKVAHMLQSGERVHATVYHGFDQKPDELLWRIDPNPLPTIYVISSELPDYSFVNSEYDPNATIKTVSYDGFLNHIEKGQSYRFLLASTPMISLFRGRDKRGRKTSLVGSRAIEWIERRLIESGAEDVKVNQDHDEKRLTFFKHGAKKPVIVYRQRHNGVLKVADPDVLRNALVSGIGPNKAYGCGLLTLIPIQEPIA